MRSRARRSHRLVSPRLVVPMLCLVAASLAAQDREGLLLEYRFEDNAQDTSGNGRHGNVEGDPVFAPGKSGKCIVLDGSGDFIDSGTNLPMLRDTFTIECWVKPAATQNRYADILGNHAGGGITGFVIQQNDTTVNEYGFGYGNGTVYVDLPRIRLTPERWHHLAVVKTRQELAFYLQGLRVGSAPADGPVAVSTVNFRVGLGFIEPARCFQGSIDEVRVWSKPLSSFDVDLPQAEKLDAFAQCVAVKASPDAAGGFFAAGANPAAVFRLDDQAVPEGIDRIEVTAEVQGQSGGNMH